MKKDVQSRNGQARGAPGSITIIHTRSRSKYGRLCRFRKDQKIKGLTSDHDSLDSSFYGSIDTSIHRYDGYM